MVENIKATNIDKDTVVPHIHPFTLTCFPESHVMFRSPIAILRISWSALRPPTVPLFPVGLLNELVRSTHHVILHKIKCRDSSPPIKIV
jgi:hypothetical protein